MIVKNDQKLESSKKNSIKNLKKNSFSRKKVLILFKKTMIKKNKNNFKNFSSKKIISKKKFLQ